jgi:hypothetical protein
LIVWRAHKADADLSDPETSAGMPGRVRLVADCDDTGAGL